MGAIAGLLWYSIYLNTDEICIIDHVKNDYIK